MICGEEKRKERKWPERIQIEMTLLLHPPYSASKEIWKSASKSQFLYQIERIKIILESIINIVRDCLMNIIDEIYPFMTKKSTISVMMESITL